ncbi:MAG: hypothetical protein FWH57_13065 [Oscillospiraceae bacterium]|nr:hypothetical protein [Oscillospiraceae bacterium]
MKYLTMTLFFLAIFALMLSSAVFGGVTLATDGNPATVPVPNGEPLQKELDMEVHFEDIESHDIANASAAPEETSVTGWDNTADALFARWEKNGYPDDVGGVYYDSDYGMLGFLLVNPTQERMDELRGMFSDEVIFTPSAFSYNELRLAQKEIDSIMGAGSGIYSTGVGWTSTDSRVHGFGDSGKEFRLVVGVDESVFNHYSAGFAQLYGDRVIVEASGPAQDGAMTASRYGGMNEDGADAGASGKTIPIVPVDISVALTSSAFYVSPSNASNSGIWLWAALGVGLVGAMLLMLRLRSRPAPVMQTVNREAVAVGSAVSKKQTVDAVRNSAITPSDGLFDSIIRKIDPTQK